MKIMNIRKISVNLADSTMKVVFRRRILVRLKVCCTESKSCGSFKTNLNTCPRIPNCGSKSKPDYLKRLPCRTPNIRPAEFKEVSLRRTSRNHSKSGKRSEMFQISFLTLTLIMSKYWQE